jgi:hypothetical protein
VQESALLTKRQRHMADEEFKAFQEISPQSLIWWVGFRVVQLELTEKTRGNKTLDLRFESSPGHQIFF